MVCISDARRKMDEQVDGQIDRYAPTDKPRAHVCLCSLARIPIFYDLPHGIGDGSLSSLALVHPSLTRLLDRFHQLVLHGLGYVCQSID